VRRAARGDGARVTGRGAVATSTPALILIVDDDYDFLEINRMILERAGYRVVTAAEPQQALIKMAKEKPDLVISDLMMTSLDSGFSFARTIKEDPRYADIPVILSTSVSSAMGLDFRPRSAEETAQMNVDAYFDKPLVPAKLLAKIEELLAARDARTAAGGPGPAAPGSG
jgi:CheY-like chemotaxis protein